MSTRAVIVVEWHNVLTGESGFDWRDDPRDAEAHLVGHFRDGSDQWSHEYAVYPLAVPAHLYGPDVNAWIGEHFYPRLKTEVAA
jgi:hypothetical protein